MNLMPKKYPAIFLDRDGTINEEMGYINHPDRFKLYDFADPAIRVFNYLGFKTVIVTNQSGVAKGYFDEKFLEQIHNFLVKRLKEQGAVIDAIYYCPHHPDEGSPKYKIDCTCRKPKPGMILKAEKELNLELSNSFLIGDRYKDIQFAHRNKLKGVLVKTGYGKGELEYQSKTWTKWPEFIAENLLDAAHQIEKFLGKNTNNYNHSVTLT